MTALAQTYDAIAFRYEQGNGINDWITSPLIQDCCPPNTKTALEIGCGVGRIALDLAKRVDTVRGIDISKGMIEFAQRRAQSADKSIRFIQGDVLTFDFGNQKFDYIYGAYITAYFDVPTLLQKLASLTCAGGRIVIVGGMGGPGSGSSWYLGQIQHYASCLRFLHQHDTSFSMRQFIGNVLHRAQFLGTPEWKNVEKWNRANRANCSKGNWHDELRATLPGARIEKITPKLVCAIWDKP